MSIESAKSFIARMKTDKGLAQKVAKCKDADEYEAIIKEEGFDVTAGEIKEATQELGDDELKMVAGGFPYHFTKPTI